MESKFRSNVVSEGSWIGQSFFVISIRGYTPPLRATKIYTSSPIPPRGIWHTFARHEAYNYGLDPENRFLEGRVGVPSIVPYFEPDFCRRIPLKDSFPSSFLARTHYHTSLKSFFFFIYLSYPRRVEGKYRGAFATFSISQESRIRFANRFKYSPSIFASCLKNNQFVSLSLKLFFTVLCNTNRVYLHLRRSLRDPGIFSTRKNPRKDRSSYSLLSFTIKRTNTHSRPIGNRCSSNLYLYLSSNHDIRYHL